MAYFDNDEKITENDPLFRLGIIVAGVAIGMLLGLLMTGSLL